MNKMTYEQRGLLARAHEDALAEALRNVRIRVRAGGSIYKEVGSKAGEILDLLLNYICSGFTLIDLYVLDCIFRGIDLDSKYFQSKIQPELLKIIKNSKYVEISEGTPDWIKNNLCNGVNLYKEDCCELLALLKVTNTVEITDLLNNTELTKKIRVSLVAILHRHSTEMGNYWMDQLKINEKALLKEVKRQNSDMKHRLQGRYTNEGLLREASTVQKIRLKMYKEVSFTVSLDRIESFLLDISQRASCQSVALLADQLSIAVRGSKGEQIVRYCWWFSSGWFLVLISIGKLNDNSAHLKIKAALGFLSKLPKIA